MQPQQLKGERNRPERFRPPSPPHEEHFLLLVSPVTQVPVGLWLYCTVQLQNDMIRIKIGANTLANTKANMS